MLIVLSGEARSGKDTAAKMLRDMLDDCQCIAYADYLKDILWKCFGLTWDQLYGDDKESLIEGLPIRTKSGHVTTHCWTPRKLLQYLGTDVFRTIRPDCWVHVVKETVAEELHANYIITDGRFPNELDWVLEAGGIHIHVQREDKDFASGTDHESETSFQEFDYETNFDQHYLIENNYSLDTLQESLQTIINEEISNGR